MAARRLILLMLVLLGISTLLASQAPRQPGGESSQETETGTANGSEQKASEPAGTGPAGGKTEVEPKRPGPFTEGVPCVPGKLCATIDVDPERISVVPVKLGEQLALSVRSTKATDLVEIPALGLIDSAAPDKPANFDLLADRQGDFGIRLVEADRLIGRIEVRPRARERSARGSADARP